MEPPYFEEDSITLKEKVEGWQSAVHNGYSQLEHQRDRLLNLELLNRFGTNGWKYHNFQVSVIS